MLAICTAADMPALQGCSHDKLFNNIDCHEAKASRNDKQNDIE
jgi:hypothetical protein